MDIIEGVIDIVDYEIRNGNISEIEKCKEELEDFISSKLKEVLDLCIGEEIDKCKKHENIAQCIMQECGTYNKENIGYNQHRQHCIEIKNKLNI